MTMRAKIYTLYPKDTSEPIDTRVSMFGDKRNIPFVPLIKNFAFNAITTRAMTICTIATDIGLSTIALGKGKFAMV